MARKQTHLHSTKTVLKLAADALLEAVNDIRCIVSDPDAVACLEDHELMNLQDGLRRIERELEYVNEVHAAKEKLWKESR